MRRKLSSDGERGVSEIYGTFLIISIVVVMALVIVGLGMIAFNNITDEADDDLVRQSMLEFDDRVAELSDQDVEGTTSMEFPEESGSEIDAEPDHGTVNVSIETDELYWNATDPPGGLLNDSDSQQNHTEITLGSLVYESDDGRVTAYQGGAVWEKQGDSVTVVSPPGLHVDEETLQLSFVDISSVEFVQEGQELSLRSDAEQSTDTADQITRVIDKQMRSRLPDGRFVANASVSLNITSEFAVGWQQYAESNLDVENATLYDASEVDGDRPKVEIELGTYGEGLTNALDDSWQTDSDVVYSGLSEFAPDLYYNGSDEWDGNITGDDPDEYEVVEPDGDDWNSTVGVLYDNESRGNGPEWWTWNGSYWTNAEDPHAEPRDSDEIPDDVVAGEPDENEFAINRDTWSCVVATDRKHNATDFRDYIPNGTEYEDDSVSNDCLESPVGVDAEENWQDYVGEFRTDFNITDFNVTVYHKNETELSDFNPEDDVLRPDYEVNMTVNGTNEGYRDAKDDEVPVGIVYDQNATSKARLGEDPRLINGTQLGTDQNDSFTLTHEFEVQDANDQYFFGVGAGTPHDSAGFKEDYTVEVTTTSDFEVNITDSMVGGSDVNEGEDVTATLNVTNRGSVEDNQTVFIWGENENERVLTTEEFSLTSGEYQETDVTWTTEVDREANWSEITASAPLSNDSINSDTADLNVNEPDDGPEFDVEITGTNATASKGESVTEGEPLTVDIEVENTGDAPGTPTAVLSNSTAGADTTVNATEMPEIADGTTRTTTLTWYTFVNDSTGDTHVKVEAGDDEVEENVTIEPQEPKREPVDVVFALDETGSMGEYRSDQNWMEIVDSKTLTSPWEVPEGDEVWATTESFNCGFFGCSERGDDYFVSGQEIDPGEYGGSVEVVKLGIDDHCSHCFDPWGERYFAVQDALGSLNESKDYAGLIEFSRALNGDANIYQDLTKNFTEINETLRIDPDGGTDISAAVFEAQDTLDAQGSPDREDFIILLTDGEHNDPFDPPPNDPAVYDYVDDDTTLFAVGFGEADETELTELVDNGGTDDSQYIPADNSSQIAEKFEQIVEENITSQEQPEIEVTDVTPVDGSTVQEGDQLTVSVDVENVGDASGDVPVMFREQFTTAGDGVPVNVTNVNITSGSTKTFNLSWDTTGAVDPGNTETAPMVVGSPEHEEETEVTIENPLASFEVNDVVTNADENESSITTDEDLVVDANITNGGDKDAAQTLVFKRNDTNLNNPVAITTNETRTISTGETTWINGTVLSPSQTVTNTTTVVVETEDGTTNKQAVNVTAEKETNVSVSIDADEINATDSAQAVDAGDTINVPVDITSDEDFDEGELVVSLYKNRTGVPQTLANITTTWKDIGDGETETFDIEWDTSGDGWDADPWVLTAEVERGADTVDVWVNEGDGPSVGGPGFGDGGSGINFDIEDIEVAD